MDNDINSRNSDNYIDINGKPVKRVAIINSDGSQYNSTDGSQVTKIKETLPTDTTKLNSSFLLSFNASLELVYADEINAGSTYRTTFTRSDMTVTSTLPISATVKL